MTGSIMPTDAMKSLMAERADAVEKYLAVRAKDVPQRLWDAMQYSLRAGGKRLRPVLCMTCAGLCGLNPTDVLPFAVAIEMIHTYSLIHDDLPAMDNDDLRRGKPSSHKAFDEATAILAGDGLLTDAFGLAITCELPPENILAATARLARAAGSSGMVGGQMLDMIYTGQKDIDVGKLAFMQRLKTGEMIEAACVCGVLLARSDIKQRDDISAYGQSLGRAFQIVDDILDVTGDTDKLGKPVGSDAEKGKITYPALIGVEDSRKLALEESEKAVKALSGYTGDEAAFLRALATYTVKRAV